MPSFDVDGFIDGYEGQVATVDICARGDLVAEHAALEAQILQRGPSDTLHDADLARLRNRLREIEAEMEESKVTFRFAAVSARAWHDLIRKHPPTKAQQAQHGPMLDHNLDTFPAAAIAAAAVDPELTGEQVDRLAGKLPSGEFLRLWEAARDVNSQGVSVPKSVAAGLIDAAIRSVESSTTAAPEESPAASSSEPPGHSQASPSSPTTTGKRRSNGRQSKT